MVSGSFSAGCLEWPRAVSGCLAPAATFFHRPSDWVLHAGALRATSAKQVHAGLRPNVGCGDCSPLTNGLTLRSSSTRVKRPRSGLSRPRLRTALADVFIRGVHQRVFVGMDTADHDRDLTAFEEQGRLLRVVDTR